MSTTALNHRYLQPIAASPILRLLAYYLSQPVSTFLNLSPTQLLTIAGIFLISCYGVKARDVMVPNVLVGVLVFFGGICQFISGIMEMISGNTFGATVFPSYGAFNLAYAMIYIPGSGILAAYTDKTTGLLTPEFSQALAIWLWAWFILTVIFTVAAMRSSWILFADLAVLSVELLLLAAGYMTNRSDLLTAGNSFGFVVAFLSCERPLWMKSGDFYIADGLY